ncbi:MAG: H-NS histone family protein [Pseudomonadota bacterium]
MALDFKSMTQKELKKLIKDAQKALDTAQARDKRDAMRAAEKAVAEFGFSLSELTEAAPRPKAIRGKRKTAKAPSKPMYANPSDPSQTWTGKGRRPNWFLSEVEKGTDPELMKI